MPAIADTTTIAEHIRLRRPRSHPIQDTDQNPQIPSIIQSARCKSSISSILLSTFTTNDNNAQTHNTTNNNIRVNNSSSGGGGGSNSGAKKKNFTSATFRGLGCAASAQVSVPAAIRTSADWRAKKVRKKKQKKGGSSKTHHQAAAMADNDSSSVVVPDIWCAPGIGFTADAAASVDCVVSRRPVTGRGKIDGDKIIQRERSCTTRRTANPEHISLLDSDSAFGRMHPASDVFGARYYRHLRHHSPEGLAEIMLFQSDLLMGRRSDVHDHYREWRLDVDNMSYEELLELGDKIGYVNTGLGEDVIGRCLRKTKLSILDDLSSHLPTEKEWKCSICQEEYEADDEMGKLDCGHAYHLNCIKQWLVRKNACPVCKAAVAAAQF